MARVAVAVTVVAALLVGLTTPSYADGDPASDVLLAGRVFVGFVNSESTPQVRELLEVTAESRRKGCRSALP